MKKQVLKWIKRYGVTVWLIAAVLALAASLTYAAYVNLDMDKWVLSTGKSNQAFFGSNYLYLTDKAETEAYSERRITKSDDVFNVLVCNYVYGNQDMVNLDDITYTFRVTLLPNGGELPADCSGISVTFSGDTQQFSSEKNTISFTPSTLSGGDVHNDSYQFQVPSQLAELVRFQVVAEPDASSYNATNNQKLAAVLTLAAQRNINNWTGQFIDNKSGPKPSEYSGFNYEISGTGKGTLILTWDKSLQISRWFLEDNSPLVQTTITDTDGKEKWQISMSVGGQIDEDTDMPSAYQLQFYKADKDAFDECSWSDLEDLVRVNFVEDAGSSG